MPESPVNNSDHYDVYQNYEIVAKRRDELQKYLRDHGIGTLVQWGWESHSSMGASWFQLTSAQIRSFF